MSEYERLQEARKVAAVRRAFEAGAYAFRKANSHGGWKPSHQKHIEHELRQVLKEVLGRTPTTEEVGLAGGDE